MSYGFVKTDTYPVKRGPFDGKYRHEPNSRTVEFLLGKCAFNRAGRKENAVTVEVTWDGANRFSVCGYIWNRNKSDCISGGQNEDTIQSARRALDPDARRLWDEIYALWKKYHLSDMKAGTTEQMGYLDSIPAREPGKDWYDWACEELKKAGLYEVPDPERPGEKYAFGTRWLTWPIPEEARKRIQAVFDWDCKKDGLLLQFGNH